MEEFKEQDLLQILKEKNSQSIPFQNLEKEIQKNTSLAKQVDQMMSALEEQQSLWPPEDLLPLTVKDSFAHFQTTLFPKNLFLNSSSSPSLNSSPPPTKIVFPFLPAKYIWLAGISCVVFFGFCIILFTSTFLKISETLYHLSKRDQEHFQHYTQTQQQIVQNLQKLKEEMVTASFPMENFSEDVLIAADLASSGKPLLKFLKQAQFDIALAQDAPNFVKDRFMTMDIDLAEGKVKSEGKVIGTLSYAKGLVIDDTQQILKQVTQIQKKITPVAPVGTFMLFIGSEKEIPEGWLLCKGQELDRREYTKLFQALRSPSQNESESTFHLPNMDKHTIEWKPAPVALQFVVKSK